MRAISRAVFVGSLLLMGAFTTPATAGLQPAIMSATINDGGVVPVIFKTSLGDMKVEEIAAIVVGAAIVGSIADMFFEGGVATILAITGGAAVGSYLYEEKLLPFID